MRPDRPHPRHDTHPRACLRWGRLWRNYPTWPDCRPAIHLCTRSKDRRIAWATPWSGFWLDGGLAGQIGRRRIDFGATLKAPAALTRRGFVPFVLRNAFRAVLRRRRLV